MNPKYLGLIAGGVLIGYSAVLLVFAHPARDYTLNTTGKAIPYSVTPEDCLTGQYPKAATHTCVSYLQALYQRLSSENK